MAVSAKASVRVPQFATLRSPGQVPTPEMPTSREAVPIPDLTSYYESLMSREDERQAMIDALARKEAADEAARMGEANRLQGYGLVAGMSGSRRIQSAGKLLTGMGSERLKMAEEKNPASVRMQLGQMKNQGEIEKQYMQTVKALELAQMNGANAQVVAGLKARAALLGQVASADARLRGLMYAADTGLLRADLMAGARESMANRPFWTWGQPLPGGERYIMEGRSGQVALAGDPSQGGMPVINGQPISVNVYGQPPSAAPTPEAAPAPGAAPTGPDEFGRTPKTLRVPRPLSADDKTKMEFGANSLWTLKDLKSRLDTVTSAKAMTGRGPLSRALVAGAAKAGGIVGKDAEDVSTWWQNFRMEVEQPRRRDIYGATLTGYEKQAWEQAQSINPGASPEKIKKALDRLIDATERGNAFRREELIRQGVMPEQVDQVLNLSVPGIAQPGAAPSAAAAPAAPVSKIDQIRAEMAKRKAAAGGK